MSKSNIREFLDRAVGPTPDLIDPMPTLRRRAHTQRIRRRSGALVVGVVAIAGIVVAGLQLTSSSSTPRRSTIVVGPGPAVQAGANVAPVTVDGVTLSVTTDPASPEAGSPFYLLVRVSGAHSANFAGMSFGGTQATYESRPSNALALPWWEEFYQVKPLGIVSSQGCPVEVFTCVRWRVDQPGVIQLEVDANATSAHSGQHVALAAKGTIAVGRPATYAALTLTVDPGTPRTGQKAEIVANLNGGPGSSASFRVDFGDGNITGSGPQNCTPNFQNPPTTTPSTKPTAVTERFRHAWTTPGAYRVSVAAFENGGCVPASGYTVQNVTITVK